MNQVPPAYRPVLVVGIDPGTITGYAVWDATLKEFWEIRSYPHQKAIDAVRELRPAFVRFEDARLRKFYGKDAHLKAQGAGAVKILCKLWEEFLRDEGIPFDGIHPIKGNTKLSAETFERRTGWKKRSNEHGRDAAMLVHGMTRANVRTSIALWEAVKNK